MTVQDITPDFFRFWQATHESSLAEQARLWDEIYETPHRQHFAASEGRHGNAERLSYATRRFADDLDRIPQMRNVVLETIDQTELAVSNLFALESFAMHWVLMVGMYWSDGWVADIEGLPTCYIALELLEAPLRAQILLPHEAAHVAHATALGDEWQNLTTVADGLFLEGLATLTSAQLKPGHDEATYLWAGLSETLSGLNVHEWLANCEANWAVLNDRLRQHLGATDPAVYAPWFFGENERSDLPQRYGYFAGFRLVQRLAEEYTVAELGRWPAERIRREVAHLL